MTDSRFLDSSAWLSYFYAKNNEIRPLVESNTLLLTSSISIFEIKSRLIKDKIEHIKLQKSMDLIKSRSLIIDIDFEIADNAVELSIKNKLHTADALIYSSALKNNDILITLDNDFRGLNSVIIID
ncbi:MAG: PIN domain-containing protein [Nanoarchaeota archaeon]